MKRKRLSTARKVALFLSAGGICHLCGGKIVGKWEVEHVVALAMGGADDESNMRPAHKVCHSPKTSTDLGLIAKVKRLEARRLGITKPSQWNKKYLRKVSGQTVLRTP